MFLEKLRIEIPYDPASGHTSRNIEIIITKKYVHSLIYCGVIHSSQDMETTYMSTDRWKYGVCTLWMLFSLNKWNSVIFNNIDKPREHYAKWNKPITEGDILRDFTYTRYPK